MNGRYDMGPSSSCVASCSCLHAAQACNPTTSTTTEESRADLMAVHCQQHCSSTAEQHTGAAAHACQQQEAAVHQSREPMEQTAQLTLQPLVCCTASHTMCSLFYVKDSCNQGECHAHAVIGGARIPGCAGSPSKMVSIYPMHAAMQASAQCLYLDHMENLCSQSCNYSSSC